MQLFDAHNDLLTQRKRSNYYLETFKKQNVNSIILAIFLSESNISIEEIINLTKGIDSKINVYFAIEDASKIRYRDLNKLKKIKPLYFSLTWNYSNSLAGGAYSKQDITDLGYKYIDKIERFSQIDSAHLNKKSFYSLAKYTKKPLFNSHTNLVSICNHKRNITNKQIKTIIQSNGLICLTGVQEFLGKKSSINTYVNSIYYFYKKYGSNNLALSSDFMSNSNYPLVYKSYNEYKIIYNLLKEKGISKYDLKKIFYSNLILFFKLKKDDKGDKNE